MAIATLLESKGYEVMTRSETLGTSAVVKRFQPHIVLTDVDMPAIEGHRLIEMLRPILAEDTVLILYSSKPATQLEDLRKQCGARGAIEKTGDLNAFFRHFQRYAARARVTL